MRETMSRLKAIARDAWESRRWPDRPQSLNVEVTAACDARCIHCPRHEMSRPMQVMPRDLWVRLIDQAAELGVTYLCPNGYGEICTLPVARLRDYLGHAASRTHRFKILVNTNGNLMSEERAAVFIEHGVHLVNVTIDGATAATAESIRLKLNFDQIESNVKRLLAMRRAAGRRFPKVRVGMIAMPQTIPEVPAFLEKWRGVADFVGIGGFSSRLGSVWTAVDEPELVQVGRRAERPSPLPSCMLPFRDLNVWADGRAVLCCEDWNEAHVVGDANTQTLHEIWHGPALTHARTLHLQGRGAELEICRMCNNWQRPSTGARLWV